MKKLDASLRGHDGKNSPTAHLIKMKAFKIKKPPRVNTVPQRLSYQHLLQGLLTVRSRGLGIRDCLFYKIAKI
jgi:hypothetical protein